jgi:hypothetical protein
MRKKRKVVYDSVYKCDRCGKEFNYIGGLFKLQGFKLAYLSWRFNCYNSQGYHRQISRHYDLCNDCARAVDEFIRKGKITI